MDELVPTPEAELAIPMQLEGEPAPTPVRPRVSRWLIVAALLSLGALGGAILTARHAVDDRAAATAARDAARTDLDAQTDINEAGDVSLVLARTDLGTFRYGLAAPLTTAEHVAQLEDQAPGLSRTIEQAGLASSIGAFNRAVDAGNANMHQRSDTADQLNVQLAELPAP